MPPSDLMIDDALDALVNQFADPMACLRELVQNAIDAGSPEVEIRIEHEPGARGDHDLVTLCVEDCGEGMDRRLIDERLTRLFGTTKEGDLTKIGRFGIGFVSIFALAPEAVCVDTSRGGENWRILFREDRTFERIARDQPVDGTEIRIFLALPPGEVSAFVTRAREAVSFWCKHAAADVRFNGARVNQPFGIDATCTVHHAEQGTEVVVGFCEDPAGRYGFYKRGLTLLEGPETTGDLQRIFFPHVAFKLSSRYLEHTLARDGVRRDDNFDKAMAIVERLVNDELPERLMQMLASPAPGNKPEDHDDLYAAAAIWFRRHRKTRLDDRISARVARLGSHLIYRSPEGTPIALDAVADADRQGRLFYEPEPSVLTEGLRAAGNVVIGCSYASEIYVSLREVRGNRPRQANACFCTAVRAADELVSRFAPIATVLGRLLRASGARFKGVRLGHLGYPGSTVADRVAITQRRFAELTDIDEIGLLTSSLLSRRRLFVVNADHPTVTALFTHDQTEPELAGYLIAKLFYLEGELTPEIDAVLAGRAVKDRCQRPRP